MKNNMMTRSLNSKFLINPVLFNRRLTSTNAAKEFDEIPGPKSYPLVGNLLSLKKYGGHLNQTLPNLLFDLQKTYGNVVKFGISKKPEIYVFDPANVEKVFTLNDKDPEKRKFDPWIIYFDELKKAQSLSNSDGQRWRKLRSSINPVLARPQAVAKHIDSQVEIVAELVDIIKARMDKQSTVDFDKFEKTLRFLSLELISKVILNRKIVAVDDRLRTMETEKFATSIVVFAKTMSDLMNSSPLWKLVSTRKWREFKKTCDEFFNFIDTYIKEALETNKQETGDNNHSVIKYLNENKVKYELTDDDISSVAAELFLGGIETMSTSLHFALYQLASEKKFQDEIYSEIKEYMKPGLKIDDELLGKFKYLKAYLKEVFRYFPIISVYGRVAKQDMILNGYKIPQGTFLNVVPVVTSKLEDVFDRPNEFDPNRWLDKTKNYHPFAFLPFGHGSRNCVARRISEQEIYIILLKILENFEVEYLGERFKYIDSTFIQPDKPLRLKFTKRQ